MNIYNKREPGEVNYLTTISDQVCIRKTAPAEKKRDKPQTQRKILRQQSPEKIEKKAVASRWDDTRGKKDPYD